MKRLTLCLLLAALSAGASPLEQRVDVGGYRLWMQVAGEGSPTVVFESGGGDDASVWAGIEPEVRQRNKVRTVLYERAGLGRSDRAPGPYHIDDEANALKKILDHAHISGPVVLVAHSYGGFVATLVADSDPRIAGVVLVDPNLAGFVDAAEVDRLLAQYKPQFAALEQARPELAKVLIPLMLAYPETARRMRAAGYPRSMPTIDIEAEHSWVETPEEKAALHKVHAEFVAESPERQAVYAAGSGHNVMRDRPQVVLDAITRMVEKTRTRSAR